MSEFVRVGHCGKEKDGMNSKISNWLLSQDEKFLSMIKDDDERAKQLNQLYNMRRSFAIFLLFTVIGFVIITTGTIIFDIENTSMLISLLSLLGPAFGYLDADSKIRVIRLYELSLAANQKP